MKSMTGFAEISCVFEKKRYNCSLSSVNRRFFDFQLYGPKQLYCLEQKIRAFFRGKIARGAIVLRIIEEKKDQSLDISGDTIEKAHSELQKIASQIGVIKEYSIVDLINLLGNTSMISLPDKKEEENFFLIMEELLAQFEEMRKEEGKHLAKDLSSRSRAIREIVHKIKPYQRLNAERVQQKLLTKLAECKEKLHEEDRARALTEAVMLAERSDITEEIVRLESHLEQFEKALEKEGSGKKLEFYLQEMGRETSTILAKSHTIELTYEVLQIKEQLEKQKEQIQNIE